MCFHLFYFVKNLDFAAVFLDLQSGQIQGEFHTHVRPIHFPYVTNECLIKLEIHQYSINASPTLPEVLMRFDQWLQRMCNERKVNLPISRVIHAYKDYALICTWAGMDIGSFLRDECFSNFINLPKCLWLWLEARQMYSVSTFYF